MLRAVVYPTPDLATLHVLLVAPLGPRGGRLYLLRCGLPDGPVHELSAPGWRPHHRTTCPGCGGLVAPWDRASFPPAPVEDGG